MNPNTITQMLEVIIEDVDTKYELSKSASNDTDMQKAMRKLHIGLLTAKEQSIRAEIEKLREGK